MITFDREYFRRYYEDDATRIRTPEELDHLLRGLVHLCHWLGAPFSTVLDAGAGTGAVRDWFAAHHKDIAVRSVDVSEAACQTYGLEERDISSWRDEDARFDLVICIGVLRYLDDAACAAAIENLALMSTRFLYLQVIASEDRMQMDPRSDFEGHWRPSLDYKRMLDKWYQPLGLGLWMRRGAPLVILAMER